jgi:hypothetical protein
MEKHNVFLNYKATFNASMKNLRWYKQIIRAALLMAFFSIIGGCTPKALVPPDLPPEQRAHIRGTFGGSIFAGADVVAVDGEMLSSENAAYILPGTHTVKLQYNRPGGGSIGPVELQFEAEAGHEYIAKWHYSWSKSIYYFSVEDGQTGNVVVSGGETPP